MKPDHKIARSNQGKPLPPLSQLKERVRTMPEAEAEALYAQCLSLSGQAFRAHVAQTLGITLSSDSKVTNFKQWFAARKQMEEFNEMVELGAEQLAAQGMSEEQVRRWAIQKTLAMAVLKEDGELALKAVDRQQTEVEAQRKAEELVIKKSQVAIEQEKLKLLQRKAEAYDRAQAALNEVKAAGGITPDTMSKIERELRLL